MNVSDIGNSWSRQTKTRFTTCQNGVRAPGPRVYLTGFATTPMEPRVGALEPVIRRTADALRVRAHGVLPTSGRRKLAIVYGNCPADAIRSLLAASPAFSERYVVLRIPAVHGITRAELRSPPVVEHLRWYRAHPDAVAVGIAEHRDRLSALGLPA